MNALILAAMLTLPRHATFGAALADKPAGTTVSRVIPGSAASGAGIQAGDVIVRLGDRPTPTVAVFLQTIHGLHAGDAVDVQVKRSTENLTFHVVMGSPPNESDPAVTTLYEAVAVDGTLRRTLVTLPKGKTGNLPAVLFMGGIGCYSVDTAADPENAYMRLAHDLSRAGFVTMRVEKSGVGDSQGGPCFDTDFAAEERMYAAALTALRSHANVDGARVYLFGHSIGTVEAPRLALQQPVAGVIVAEAVGRDWPEYEVRNLRRQLELGGSTPAETDRALLEKQICMNRLLLEKQDEPAIEADLPFCKVPNGVYPVAAPYMQQVAAVNIIEAWTKIAVPVLAIYGQSDVVTEADDHRRIVDVVNAHHPHSATYRALAGMDHFLFVAATPAESLKLFSNASPRKYDAAISRAVVQWLTRLSRV